MRYEINGRSLEGNHFVSCGYSSAHCISVISSHSLQKVKKKNELECSCNSAYVTGLDVSLLKKQVYCRKADHTIRLMTESIIILSRVTP
jgi:hypothetical protein